ncbi:hypothetical protein [Bacteroides reticulotermitis]|uniref:hypothetical protein n=1 Tax=Bacteroides reticulotermitis TaxID=1133319 RepID=UPI003A875D13
MHERLLEEAQNIQSYLEITMNDDPVEVVNRGNDLLVYMARTAKMLADAKLLLNTQKKDETMQIVRDFIFDQKLSAKVQNALIDGLCRDVQYLVDWIERLNAACTHQLDWCRTVVSKYKEELRLTKTGY